MSTSDHYNNLAKVVDSSFFAKTIIASFNRAPVYHFDEELVDYFEALPDWETLLKIKGDMIECAPGGAAYWTNPGSNGCARLLTSGLRESSQNVTIEFNGREVFTTYSTLNGKIVKMPLTVNGVPMEVDGGILHGMNHGDDPSSLRHMIIISGVYLTRILKKIDYRVIARPSFCRPPAAKKAIRFHERELTLVLSEGAFKKRYADRKNLGGTHASPRPHLRRGHSRTLKSPRFKNKVGQTISLDPMSVGNQSEWEGANGIKYRVIQ